MANNYLRKCKEFVEEFARSADTGDIPHQQLHEFQVKVRDLVSAHSHPHRSTTTREIYRHENFKDEAVSVGDHPVSHMTTFYRLEKEGWYCSHAYCSINDNFSRSMGRKVARRNYFNGHTEKCDCPVKERKGGSDEFVNQG